MKREILVVTAAAILAAALAQQVLPALVSPAAPVVALAALLVLSLPTAYRQRAEHISRREAPPNKEV